MLSIVIDVCLLLLGIAIVLWGADKFTDGASSMARRWNVSEMVIGLTVVALGTSMPEFVVSFFSALDGSADMSVGNVVGSNVFNSLFILGASALFISLTLTKKLLTRDILFVIFSSLILVALSTDGEVSRGEGLVLLMCFCMYMFYSFYSSRQDSVASGAESAVYSWGKTILFLVLGISCLVGGGNLLVSSATSLAMSCGMSERVVGLTILAGGTSLPELATSVVAARKGSRGMALGNVVGSNLFNIFFILGTSALICPLRISGIGMLDWVALVGSAVIMFVFGGTGRKITRTEGVVMLGLYLLYMVALVMGWQIKVTF
jgi:cation:H+ antiporter